MKLAFRKDGASEISVFQIVGEVEQKFTYVNMIKALIESRAMEPPEISEGFTEAEVASINSMVKHINEKIAPTDELRTKE